MLRKKQNFLDHRRWQIRGAGRDAFYPIALTQTFDGAYDRLLHPPYSAARGLLFQDGWRT